MKSNIWFIRLFYQKENIQFIQGGGRGRECTSKHRMSHPKVGSHFCRLNVFLSPVALVIVGIILNVIVRQMAPNNDVSIVHIYVVKLSNTSTMFSQQVKIT